MRAFFCLFSLLCFLSCADSSTPKGVLSPKKMEAILYDAIKADEFIDFSSIQDSTFRQFSKRTALYDSLLHLHNITKENFRKSFEYYQDHPDRLKKILESLRQRTDTTSVARPVKGQ